MKTKLFSGTNVHTHTVTQIHNVYLLKILFVPGNESYTRSLCIRCAIRLAVKCLEKKIVFCEGDLNARLEMGIFMRFSCFQRSAFLRHHAGN